MTSSWKLIPRVTPITGMPDREVHRICRRCQKWYDAKDGARMAPEVSGPLSGMQAMRASMTQDASLFRFQCHRCTAIRRITQVTLWLLLAAILVTVLLMERL